MVGIQWMSFVPVGLLPLYVIYIFINQTRLWRTWRWERRGLFKKGPHVVNGAF